MKGTYHMKVALTVTTALAATVLLAGAAHAQHDIPLPEHPRPDFERPAWVNLNGTWQFRFDPRDEGLAQSWQQGEADFPLTITVPFPWGSALSGVPDSAQIGWYARTIEVPAGWEGRRVFLVIGAADWHTTAWLDGQKLGEHQGGYTPFEFELTPHVRPGTPQRLTLRVDDVDRAFKLEGKQGYGNARGIWQTPYLEARGTAALAALHFTPDIDAKKVTVDARLLEAAPQDLTLRLAFKNGSVAAVERRVARGETGVRFEVAMPDQRLWSLKDPFLYEVEARLAGAGPNPDVVNTYFGMRKISVVDLPGTNHRYVALNDEPVYLQLTLDQAYHPDGFYTFPSDAFVRDEVLRARQIGLTGLREHVKVETPRKLYWADRLGVLIMADVPNSWGEPTAEMRQEIEETLREMIQRDYNHPSIFSWIPFNETWGLFTNVPKEPGEEKPKKVYRPETQKWVASVYRLAKSLDATRLVEDNSVCCGRGHTETDLNSWHAYLPGWAWDEELDKATKGTEPGSTWNFESGYKQDRQPNINSEFGNVWGYEGSTGDVDWSWDYHRAVNSFRRHPRVAGWLYTEHHDVINEWNGYWRFDRTEKFTGMEDLAPGMTLAGPPRAALHRRGRTRRPEPLGEGGRDGGGAALGLLPDGRHRLGRRARAAGAPLRVEHPGPEANDLHDTPDRALSSLDVRGASAAVGADAERAGGGRPRRRADRSSGHRPAPQLHHLRGRGGTTRRSRRWPTGERPTWRASTRRASRARSGRRSSGTCSMG